MATTSRRKERKMISTRILIISDTHAQLPSQPGEGASPAAPAVVPFQAPLPAADVLIHCGDLTMNGALSQHEAAATLLRNTPSETLKIVVPGNHDITLDRGYYARFPRLHAHYDTYADDALDRIRELYTGQRARDAGIRYLEEGVAAFTLRNGAHLTVYASAWQPEFCNWAFGYERGVDRFNHPCSRRQGPETGDDEDGEQAGQGDGHRIEHEPPSPVPVPDHGEIDIVVTHGPPRGILDKVWAPGPDGVNHGENVGCDHLRRAVGRCRPRIHCFGHIHEAWGAVWKRWFDGKDGGGVGIEIRGEGGYTSITGGDVGRDEHDDGTETEKREGRGEKQNGSATRRSNVEDVSFPSSMTEQRQRQQTQQDSTISPSQFPNPPYHPKDNPNCYYMYKTQNPQQDVPGGETLLQPDPYEEQIRQRCATTVDARGLEFGAETLFVNASIMNLRYRPVNAPWLVDVMLPEAEDGDQGGGTRNE
ncbi:hypothetical protein AYO21_09573 [Fonsecaea monophora]|uniref:Calcineurin-like phosphoesterase domain-containing protein n=1 Tax=Fonsecaea monophora TaxID=254056 RepID=A0A177EZ89_9EURO|nr:hypothetical protein AYO21_09573 [Fonsecaea monophora]KAH0848856.1 metallophosphoesterase domain-containing protein [Fonsecaea pedrosoi]OAG36259.1 hypothetical protein AYO21_09573 [Fonsecaea monophora]